MTRPATGSAGTVRIGLTGPIGCGKSTVAAWLGELGATVIDADQVAHEVTAAGSPAIAAIARTFGGAVVRADGTLDRAALGRIVFSEPDALARLEAIVHPAVRPVILEAMAAAEAAGAPAVVVEAIKLVEGGLAEVCDEIWLVTCSADDQLARVRARLRSRAAAVNAAAVTADAEGPGAAGRDAARAAGSSAADGATADGSAAANAPSAADRAAEADAEARIAAHAGLVERLTPFASRVLDTSGPIEAARARAALAYREALSARG